MSEDRDLVAGFEAAYATTPPWDIGRPQPAFAALAANGGLVGAIRPDGVGKALGESWTVPVVEHVEQAHMLCFSEEEPSGWGPRRVTRAEVHETFRHGWTIDSIEATELHVTVRPEPAKAWFCSIRRDHSGAEGLNGD